jgi:hypothetical protein
MAFAVARLTRFESAPAELLSSKISVLLFDIGLPAMFVVVVAAQLAPQIVGGRNPAGVLVLPGASAFKVSSQATTRYSFLPLLRLDGIYSLRQCSHVASLPASSPQRLCLAVESLGLADSAFVLKRTVELLAHPGKARFLTLQDEAEGEAALDAA